jgi:hypothetical protein
MALNQSQTDMKYLDKNSLFQTVDNVSEALLYGLKIDVVEKTEIAEFNPLQKIRPN